MTTHVYFDLDGTLTDPDEGITNCILYALDELGFPRPDDDYLYSCIGPPLWDTFPELVGQDLTRKAVDPVSYTHLTLPTICFKGRARRAPGH